MIAYHDRNELVWVHFCLPALLEQKGFCDRLLEQSDHSIEQQLEGHSWHRSARY